MLFNALLCVEHVTGTYGCSLRWNPAACAGLTEYAVEGVLCDCKRMKRYNLCGLLEILVKLCLCLEAVTLNVNKLGAGINKRDVSCPAGTSGEVVDTAVGLLVDEVGVVGNVFGGGVENILL